METFKSDMLGLCQKCLPREAETEATTEATGVSFSKSAVVDMGSVWNCERDQYWPARSGENMLYNLGKN